MKTRKRIERLTAAQTARFGEYVERWTAIGLSTEPADRPTAEAAIATMYRCGGLEPPQHIVWCKSPLSMLLTAAVLRRRDSVGASVRDSVGASVRDSVGATVRDSVEDSVGASVGASVRDSVGATVEDSVRASAGASVGASVWDSVRASVGDLVGGQHEAYWLAFYAYFREVCGIEEETKQLDGLLALSKSAGWALPYRDICFVSERHTTLLRDERGRLHAEDGPAVRYPDGWAVWAWHGVRVPQEVIEASASGSGSQGSMCAPSAMSSASPTRRRSSGHASPTATSTTLPSGTMSAPSTEAPGVGPWISSLRASRASRTPSLDGGPAMLTSATYGRTPSESFARFDPTTCSWRTLALISETGWHRHTLTPSWLTLPASGMTRGGHLYRLPPLVPHTSVGAGGALPTPVVSRHPQNRSPSPGAAVRLSREGMAGRGLWPTPTAADSERQSATYMRGWWRTPRANDGKGGLTFANGSERASTDFYLPDQVNMVERARWPTPRASDGEKGLDPDHEAGGRHAPALPTTVGGKLNPRWVEWLMGIPIGWTSCAPLAMASYRQWWHGSCGDGS